MNHFMYDSTTIELANQMFPTVLVPIGINDWAYYMNQNKQLMMALMTFRSDCQRVSNYRQQKLDSWPSVSVQWETIGGVTRVSSLDAIRLSYFINSDIQDNQTINAFRIAEFVMGKTTNYQTRYLGYS